MKPIIKRIMDAWAMLLVVPAWILYRVAASVVGRDRAFPGWSQLLALWPGWSGITLRRAFYRLTLRRCGDHASIGFGTVFARPDIAIGTHAYIGNYCSLGDVVIEDDALLASFVSVLSGSAQHGIDRLDIPVREQPGRYARVTIGRDAWIGERAVVMADVGRHCVIGAGAVVTQPVPDYAIAVGVPARVIGYRPGAPVRIGA